MPVDTQTVLGVCESRSMTSPHANREELLETIAKLRDEVVRLKEEIRQIRRETNETPPHYL